MKYASVIVDEYNNQPLIRGTTDCNLLFLKLHEPEKHDKIKGRYKTLIGGVRVARKIFGNTSIHQYLKESNEYIEVHPNFQLPLDVVAYKSRHDICISLGDKWFGVDESDTFSIVPSNASVDDNYTIFRKVK